ncbi:hypothetical protein ABVT39_020810 [Epinephelus coioides]
MATSMHTDVDPQLVKVDKKIADLKEDIRWLSGELNDKSRGLLFHSLVGAPPAEAGSCPPRSRSMDCPPASCESPNLHPVPLRPLFPPSTVLFGDSIIRNIRFFNATTHCFPGAKVPVILDKLPELHSLPSSINRLIFHLGSNDTARWRSELTKMDFVALFNLLKNCASGLSHQLNQHMTQFTQFAVEETVRRLHNSEGNNRRYEPEQGLSSPHNGAMTSHLVAALTASPDMDSVDRGVLLSACKTYYETVRRNFRYSKPDLADQAAAIKNSARSRQRRKRERFIRILLYCHCTEKCIWVNDK